MNSAHARIYRGMAVAARGNRLPSAWVDLDALDRNIDFYRAQAQRAGKKIRVASKSIRHLGLLHRIQERLGEVFIGLMAFSPEEAEMLVAEGYKDVFVAYPTCQRAQLKRLSALQARATVSIAVDDIRQIEAAKNLDAPLPVVLDLDGSVRGLGGRLHLGVRRSPLRRVAEVVELAKQVVASKHHRLHGVMLYEAVVAGLSDTHPIPGASRVVSAIKARAKKRAETLRATVIKALQAEGIEVPIVNGGGSGSYDSTLAEEVVTELTVGSGFLCSHHFDHYQSLDLLPAVAFAIEVTRQSDPGFVTCSGGGYIASGEAGKSRLPIPVWPAGLSLVDVEGAGEVQTPVTGPVLPELGDCIVFRHTKTGELAERFNQYHLLRGGKEVGVEPTYRGQGHCFF